MTMRLTTSAVIALAICAPHAIEAQALQEIGTISGGNPAMLETRTVKKAGDEITATVRVKFLKPAKAPGGEWFGSRTVVAVRCSAGTVAVKENRYYADAMFKTIASEKIVKIPGYAAPVPGSVPALALKTLCTG